MTKERLEILLANLIVYLEDEGECNIWDTEIPDEIGLTPEEYDELMDY